jgi:hypothetical protein
MMIGPASCVTDQHRRKPCLSSSMIRAVSVPPLSIRSRCSGTPSTSWPELTVIDTNSLEWKLRKFGESLDMLRHSMYLHRNRELHEMVGKSQMPWLHRKG